MSGLFFDNWDTPVFRPPSESDSFILRVTRGCAHNSCTYCNMYRGVRFEKLSDDEIMRQIAMAYSVDRDGVRRVFLADGDALVLPTERLLRILETLRKYFPNLTRVSSYAAPGDILRKSLDELKQLKDAGLTMLFGNTMQDFLADKIGLDLISITSNLTDYYDNIDDNNDSYYYIKIGKYLFNDFMLTATMGVNNEEKSLGFHYDLNSRVGLSSWYNSNHDSYIGSDWSFKF